MLQVQVINEYSMQFQLVPHFSLSVQDTYKYMYCIGPPPPLGLWAVHRIPINIKCRTPLPPFALWAV